MPARRLCILCTDAIYCLLMFIISVNCLYSRKELLNIRQRCEQVFSNFSDRSSITKELTNTGSSVDHHARWKEMKVVP